jgi:NADH-quinone oxidoreductase subunit M
VLILPARHANRPWLGARAIALTFAIAALLAAALAAGRADFANAPPAATTSAPTAARGTGMPLVLHFTGIALGIDGLSLPLLVLTAALGVIAGWASYGVKHGPRRYYALLLLFVAAALAALVTLNALTLLICLMIAAVALFFLLAGWGADRKVPAARRFLYFAVLAIAALLTSLLLRFGSGVFSSAADWSAATTAAAPVPVSLPPGSAAAFWFMLFGCATLAAVFPLHWWLADSVAEGSTPLALLTVGIMQTLGAYALLRLAPLVVPPLGGPVASTIAAWPIALVGTVTMLYGALAALGQSNLKRLAAFASVSLMGATFLGIAAATPTALLGAGHLLVGRALAVVLLLLVAGMIEQRLGHCDLPRLGGLAGHLPALGIWGAPAILGPCACPALSVFPGLFLIILGTFQRAPLSDAAAPFAGRPYNFPVLAALATLALALLLATGVWTYQRVFLGAPRPEHSNVAPLSLSERWILALLTLAAVTLGLWPGLAVWRFGV